MDLCQRSEALAALPPLDSGWIRGGGVVGKEGFRWRDSSSMAGEWEFSEGVKHQTAGVLERENLDIGLSFFGARTIGLFGGSGRSKMFEVVKGQRIFESFLAIFGRRKEGGGLR